MFFIDMNLIKAKPSTLNPVVLELVQSYENDFYANSYLDNFKGTLAEFIKCMKGRISDEPSYTDFLHINFNEKDEKARKDYHFATLIIKRNCNERVLGIILVNISKQIDEQLRTLENFKETLVSALTHELNNPMNSLIPLIRMMPNCKSKENSEDIKGMALSAASVLQNKINDLIDYSRLETGSMKLNITEFSVEELFDELKQIFKFEAKQKENELMFQLKSTNNTKLIIQADRSRVDQVLIKLISNANKYTNKGKITVTAKENKTNFNVCFSVIDTGIGMAKKSKELLFAPLCQKNWYRSKSGRLPGLGLDIASKICNSMGCKLIAISEESKGSTFYFEIPSCRVVTFQNIEEEEETNSIDRKRVV